MLQPIDLTPKKEPEFASDSPLRTCEACGKQILSHFAINDIHCIGSAGHWAIMPFQCLQEEHWACSIECWAKVAHACIDEHLVPMLHLAHSNVPDSPHNTTQKGQTA